MNGRADTSVSNVLLAQEVGVDPQLSVPYDQEGPTHITQLHLLMEVIAIQLIASQCLVGESGGSKNRTDACVVLTLGPADSDLLSASLSLSRRSNLPITSRASSTCPRAPSSSNYTPPHTNTTTHTHQPSHLREQILNVFIDLSQSNTFHILLALHTHTPVTHTHTHTYTSHTHTALTCCLAAALILSRVFPRVILRSKSLIMRSR